MPSRKKFDAVATVGEYQQQGETKKRYQRVGAVFEDEQGRMSLKLDAVPVGQFWSGWISFFEPRPRQQQPATGYPSNEREAQRQPQQNQPPLDTYAGANPPDDDFDDDIPF